MAALQKVRSAGPIVVIAIFLGLFGFIATDWAKVVEIFTNADRNTVGEIYGEDLSVTDFNRLVDEYTDVIKATQGVSNLSDEQMQSLRDQVWQTYVQNQLIAHEADKLGLTVTDKEVQQIIQTGASPMLQQTPFTNQQGQFDPNALKQFLDEYQKSQTNTELTEQVRQQYATIYNWWKFIEKSIRQQTLAQKYQTLLASSILSNPISAKQNFDERTNEATALMAAVPYTTLNDKDFQVTDDELKAKYEEQKELFVATRELRDIKYIDVAVTASKSDEEALDKDMNGYAKELAAGTEPAKVVREAQSLVPYSVLPVSGKSLPNDIATKLDSMSVGQQVGPYYNAGDNTMNIVRLIGKTTQADSIQFRMISAPGKDIAAAEKTADSIVVAINGGTPFDSIAKKYNQSGEKQWLTSAQYDGRSLDDNNKKYLESIIAAAPGSVQKVVLEDQAVIVINVLDKKSPISKYDVAVIKTTRDFSKDTYNKAFNDLSSFLAGKTAEELEAGAAKAGYAVQELPGITSDVHNVANVASTRDALRWIFNSKTEIGDVSPLYECGDNDHLLCVVLTGIHEKGYFAWDDKQVKDYLTQEVISDKKAAKIQGEMQSAKSLSDVMKIKGAVSDTLRNVTFAQSVFVPKTGAMEPVLSGSISTQKKGAFKQGIKGNAAVYAYQILSTDKKAEKYDKKTEESMLVQNSLRGLGNFAEDLYLKANVTDNRYLFY